MTPAKYLSSLRIEHAIHLMKEFPYYSLEAISEQSGFSTERSFYRIFSDLFGITPNTYRKTLK
jgi:transcriptional regulator GlxA family with amidase domain